MNTRSALPPSSSVGDGADVRGLHRRDFCRAGLALGAAAFAGIGGSVARAEAPFRLQYIVASCMYGTASLEEIVPEVPKTGATHLELWDRPHGAQREQVDRLGVDGLARLLKQHDVQLGGFTCFKRGIFDMQSEMRLIHELGGDLAICNTPSPKSLGIPDSHVRGSDEPAEVQQRRLKDAIEVLAFKLRPHVEFAEKLGVTIGVENHANGIIHTPESILALMQAIPSPRLGIALAPYHLPQDPALIADLIERLGSRLVHFQAWQHGRGSGQLPKEEEMQQMPGRGPLDFAPLLAALKKIDYAGRTQIFMHPYPRGVAIRPTTAEVTDEINRSRRYLESRLPA